MFGAPENSGRPPARFVFSAQSRFTRFCAPPGKLAMDKSAARAQVPPRQVPRALCPQIPPPSKSAVRKIAPRNIYADPSVPRFDSPTQSPVPGPAPAEGGKTCAGSTVKLGGGGSTFFCPVTLSPFCSQIVGLPSSGKIRGPIVPPWPHSLKSQDNFQPCACGFAAPAAGCLGPPPFCAFFHFPLVRSTSPPAASTRAVPTAYFPSSAPNKKPPALAIGARLPLKIHRPSFLAATFQQEPAAQPAFTVFPSEKTSLQLHQRVLVQRRALQLMQRRCLGLLCDFPLSAAFLQVVLFNLEFPSNADICVSSGIRRFPPGSRQARSAVAASRS